MPNEATSEPREVRLICGACGGVVALSDFIGEPEGYCTECDHHFDSSGYGFVPWAADKGSQEEWACACLGAAKVHGRGEPGCTQVAEKGSSS